MNSVKYLTFYHNGEDRNFSHGGKSYIGKDSLANFIGL